MSRNHPILFKKRHHKGMDFAAKAGTEVMAVADGKVLVKGHLGSFGNLISLSHENNKETRYGHLLKFSPNIKIGDKFKKGQVIGYVGITGLATAPHLHFEFIQNGKQIDPRKMLSAKYIFDVVEKKKFDESVSKYFEVIDNFKSFQNI